ncbi:unnamed protein product [Clonostachys rosea]|uniref:Uncharacterized protein n=1 Tax=Bionectria ochroleuca TaxID=29856 RepID=A0ABY6UHQ7_BIOOC|nr:unnamed protein product [Clonostachys rosea]
MIASLEKKVNSSKKRTRFLTSMKVVFNDEVFEKLEKKFTRLNQLITRAFQILMTDSQPFVYARDGNLSGLLQCFDRSEATPFDKDVFGWSLIHHAAFSQKIDICKKLLDLGVDVNERTNSLETCLRCFSSITYGTLPDQDRIDFTGFLLSRGAEIECYADEPQDEQLGALYEGTVGSFSLLQSHLFPHYYDEELTTRLLCALRFALNPWSPAEQFRVSLHQRGEITAEDIKRSEEFHLPILNIALLGLSIRLQRRAAVDDLHNWQSLVSLVLSESRVASGLTPLPMLDTAFIKSACSGQKRMATPLLCVIIGSLKAVGHVDVRWKMGVGKAARSWVKAVKDAGMDINQYGRAEQSNLSSESPSNYFHRGRKIWARGLARLERLDVGSEVEDWELWWNEHVSGNQGQEDGFASTDELGGYVQLSFFIFW